MFAIALLPFLAFGLLALAPVLDTSDDSDDLLADDNEARFGEDLLADDPVTEDPATEDPAAEDPAAEDPATEDPAAEDPAVEDPAAEDPATPAAGTTVQFTAADGTTTEVVVDATDPEADVIVSGTEEAETIATPTEIASSFGINGLGGDDTINFGYGVDVDGGEGADALTLSITDEALANGDLVTGVVDFADTTDSLAIDIPEGTTGFLHEVRIETSESPDANTTTNTAALVYILSPEETLTIDEEASAAAGDLILPEGSEILIGVALGSQTTVTGTDAEGAPTTEVTGAINEDPNVLANRDITSSTTLTI